MIILSSATRFQTLRVYVIMAGQQNFLLVLVVCALLALNGDCAGVQGASEDGHFLKVTATVTSVVPEPGTGVLLAMGLAGIVAQRRRSRA